jgi:hypothetical protein
MPTLAATGLSSTVLRALKSGPVIPTNDRDREEKPSDASAVMRARLQAKRLAGLALGDQRAQKDARTRWRQRVLAERNGVASTPHSGSYPGAANRAELFE